VGHSIKKGVKMCSNHTGPQREQKDARRAWPSMILGAAYRDNNGWYAGPDGKTPNFKEKLQSWRKNNEAKKLSREKAKKEAGS